MSPEKLHVLGIMSGSSLDGVDFGLFSIDTSDTSQIEWTFVKKETISYPAALKENLRKLRSVMLDRYFIIENDYTQFLSSGITSFLGNHTCDLIGLHGHTVIHAPQQGYSIQLGNGAAIAESSSVPCVTDFRNQDIARDGEGAPMAPLVDRLLFPGYDGYINLGGIVNVTLEDMAFDIGPFNQVINHIAGKCGMEMDRNGKLGREGSLNKKFAEKLNAFQYYNKSVPKSLDNSTLQEYFSPLIDESNISIEDMMHTFYHHIADKIVSYLPSNGKILLSGGGAYNTYFVNLLESKLTDTELIVPADEIIDYKESILIALAAQLRYFKKPNYLSPFTKAYKEVSAGALYIPASDG